MTLAPWMRSAHRPLLATLALTVVVHGAPREARAQVEAPPNAYPYPPPVAVAAPPAAAPPLAAPSTGAPPACSTTTTCATQTTCTGDAAPLALQPPSVQVVPQPPLPAWLAPGAYAPAPACPSPPAAVAPGPAAPGSYVQPWLPQYRLVEHKERNGGLAVAGAITFASTWMPMVAAGWMLAEHQLMVPVLGPFLEVRRMPNPQIAMLLVFDGLAQGAGLVMLIAGATTQHTVKRREPITMVPTFSSTSAGLVAMGRF